MATRRPAEPATQSAVVWLVDDDTGFRDATAWLLRSIGLDVRAYSGAASFLSDFDPATPGCVLTDLRMPGTGGLLLQRQIAERCPIPIIFVSGHAGVGSAVAAMKGGAMDFLEKPVDDNLLIERIQQAIQQDRRRRDGDSALDGWRSRLAALTPREREVMALVLKGRVGKQIAYELGISIKTVEAHKTSILRKIESRSWLELANALPDELRSDL